MMRWGVILIIFTGVCSEAESPPPNPPLPTIPKRPLSKRFPQIKQLPRQPLPNSPSTPAEFDTAPVDVPQRCERKLHVNGKSYRCDSYFAKNAEGLRPILSATPEAEKLLNQYQVQQDRIENAAIVGSIGLVAALVARIVIRMSPGASTGTRTALTWTERGGLGLIALGGGFALTGLSYNERTLERAISVHNTAHPENAVTLGVKTDIDF